MSRNGCTLKEALVMNKQGCDLRGAQAWIADRAAARARSNPFAQDNWRNRDMSSPMHDVYRFQAGHSGKPTKVGKTHKVRYPAQQIDGVWRGIATKGPGEGKPRKGRSSAPSAGATAHLARTKATMRECGCSLKEALVMNKQGLDLRGAQAWIAARARARSNPIAKVAPWDR
jgi:hypothetical protein